MRFATALGIDDLLRACTYESVYDGDAEILSRRFGEEKSESARQNVCLSEAVLARRARARSIGKTRVSRSAPKKCETQIYRSVLTVSAPCRTRPSWFTCEWHHRLARFPKLRDARRRSEGAVARFLSASEGSIGNLMVSLKKAAKHNSHRRCDVANRQPPCARSRAPSKKPLENQKKYRGARIGSIGKCAPISAPVRAEG